MKNNNNKEVFFALLRAGLWETMVQLVPFGNIEYAEVQRLAEEQSVVGLIAAGLEHVTDQKVPKKDVFQFIGQTLQMEQRNTAMNVFVGNLIEKMREAGIYTFLVKGQGIAQCYERPLWRSCGDVDLLLSEDNYQKAKEFLMPLASSVEPEGLYSHHLGITIDSWVVELHGSLRCGFSNRIDRVLDKVKDEIFFRGNVRSWMNGRTHVFLPGVNVDIIYIFSHILNHFYKGGIGLRQLCDWCRFLWVYRESIDVKQLQQSLKEMKLITEWKAFGSFATAYLGMPVEAMPLYSPEKKWKRKAKRICSFILEVGNFGHNRDSSYFARYPYLIRKFVSFGVRFGDFFRHLRLFPVDSLKFFPTIVLRGVFAAAKGE